MSHLLQVLEPLAALPVRLREQVARQGEVLRLPRGRVLFEQDDQPQAIYSVLTGRLSLHRLGCNGHRRTVCFSTAGCLCCCVVALDGGPCPATATAATETTVALLPHGLFRELLTTQPGFAEAVLRQIGRQLRQFQCDGAATGDAGARIAGKILVAAAQFGDDLPLTRREIAELAGTRVETAIRETRRFEEAGWIALRRGHVRILDRDALCAEAGTHGLTPPPPREPVLD